MNRISTFSLPTLKRYSFVSKRRFTQRHFARKYLGLKNYAKNGAGVRLENFWVLGFTIIITLLALCVFQVLNQTKTSYLIENYEKKITKLSQENNELQILLSQQNSLKDLKETAEHFKFEPIAKVHYIKVLGGAVAKQ